MVVVTLQAHFKIFLLTSDYPRVFCLEWRMGALGFAVAISERCTVLDNLMALLHCGTSSNIKHYAAWEAIGDCLRKKQNFVLQDSRPWMCVKWLSWLEMEIVSISGTLDSVSVEPCKLVLRRRGHWRIHPSFQSHRSLLANQKAGTSPISNFSQFWSVVTVVVLRASSTFRVISNGRDHPQGVESCSHIAWVTSSTPVS